MGAASDKVQGQAQAGSVSHHRRKDLESEGKADRHAGEAREKFDEAKDTAADLVDEAKHKLPRQVNFRPRRHTPV